MTFTFNAVGSTVNKVIAYHPDLGVASNVFTKSNATAQSFNNVLGVNLSELGSRLMYLRLTTAVHKPPFKSINYLSLRHCWGVSDLNVLFNSFFTKKYNYISV
jgi:hypothetical protein